MLKLNNIPNWIRPLIIETVEAKITTLRIFGNTIDKFPVVLAGRIMKITTNVILHQKMEKIM
ncbi:protein of unknown function [Candidatus Nitrosocosmicus franklandus]|uniref:Uncharacterized protein n=1 Tax=Candidatus Nitrosocosmicus franklandianus TaxID=1798806 RepID=A0A484IEK9_9ARCH|nr:protein of unknown function [Candidatus Nitrosocosmicus franklandus]